jgi:hypothetical protein
MLVTESGLEGQFVFQLLTELARAREKHPGEEGVLTDAEWLAVLTEEVGECARAIQDEGDDELKAELVQVAAMALRWWLSVPLGRRRPPWASRTVVDEPRRVTIEPAARVRHELPVRFCWSGPTYSHRGHEWDKPRGETFWCPGASTDRT